MWPEKCETVAKLRTNYKFKTCFITEPYWTINLKRNERSVLTQFYCSVLRFRVETGRFVDEQVHERLYKLCYQSTVEDKTHFL